MQRLLIIEDNEDDCLVMRRAFAESAFDVTFVSTVKDGFKELEYDDFDLVICDMMMPGEDGLSFAKRLSQQESSVRFILTSGIPALRRFDNYTGLKHYLGFILKPVTPEKVERVLYG